MKQLLLGKYPVFEGLCQGGQSRQFIFPEKNKFEQPEKADQKIPLTQLKVIKILVTEIFPTIKLIHIAPITLRTHQSIFHD